MRRTATSGAENEPEKVDVGRVIVTGSRTGIEIAAFAHGDKGRARQGSGSDLAKH